MKPLTKDEKDILNFMANINENEGDKAISKSRIFNSLKLSNPNYVLIPLFEKNLIEQKNGVQAVNLTEKGYNIARGIVENVAKNITFSGNVNGSAISFDNSNASVSNTSARDILLTLADQIQANPDIPDHQKKKWTETIRDLAKHPLVAGILSSILALSLG